MESLLKNTTIELTDISSLLTDIDMLLLGEKEIRGRICHAIHLYATANNKYMKNYNKDKESL